MLCSAAIGSDCTPLPSSALPPVHLKCIYTFMIGCPRALHRDNSYNSRMNIYILLMLMLTFSISGLYRASVCLREKDPSSVVQVSSFLARFTGLRTVGVATRQLAKPPKVNNACDFGL